MYKLIIIVFFIFLSFYSNVDAQNENQVRFSLSTEIADLGYEQFNFTGVKCQLFINRNLSLNYNYSIGWTDDGRMLFHFPVMFLSFLWLDDINEASFLALLAPEGVSYHCYPDDFLEVELYCNPLCSDYNILDNELITVTFDFGIKPHFRFNESISIAPNFGLKLLYGTGDVKQMTGLSLEAIF